MAQNVRIVNIASFAAALSVCRVPSAKLATELQNANYRKGVVISHQAMFDAQAADRITQLENELAIAQGTKNRLTIFDRIEIHDKAKMETAKAIFEELRANEEPNPEYCDCWLVAVTGEKFIQIAKKYGVEVKP